MKFKAGDSVRTVSDNQRVESVRNGMNHAPGDVSVNVGDEFTIAAVHMLGYAELVALKEVPLGGSPGDCAFDNSKRRWFCATRFEHEGGK